MTKAEMEAIRARWHRNMGTLNSVSFAVAGQHDIPALLDALEEAEADRDHWKAERDRWKQQAESYEERLVISPYGDDKIDEPEDAMEYAKADRDQWKLLAEQNLKTAELVLAESDRWKARAEALERALREEMSCATCKSVMTASLSEPCSTCDRGQENLDNWVFDESRFAPADTPHK